MPNFTYNLDIPLSTNNPSVDQPNMEVNTNSIAGILNVDLIGFGNTNGGFHNQSTYVDQGADPGSASGQVVEYSKSVSSSSELFIQRDSVSTPIQLTNGTVNIAGNATGVSKGHSFLPGGLIIQWGSLVATTGGTTFTFDKSFATIYSITGAIQAAGAQAMAFAGVSITGATAYSASGSQTVNYIAIGV